MFIIMFKKKKGNRMKNKPAVVLRIFYPLLQCTWGFPQTFIGALIFLFHLSSPHQYYKGSIVTTWKQKNSVSLGLFLFLSADAVKSERILRHEYGHTIQSLFLGPLYLIVVGLPSFLWCGLPFLVRYRDKHNIDYFSFFIERNADYFGKVHNH